jgi:DNA polymerase
MPAEFPEPEAKIEELPPLPRALSELAAARDPDVPHEMHHDAESRSRVDLKTVGGWKYAADPSTEVLCVAYAVDDEPVQLWVPGDPAPSEWFEAAGNPNWTVFEHGAFDRLIAQQILEPRHGFPAIPIERRRCSMARALAAALPASLDKAAEALGLPFRKDKAGHALMLRMTKPLPDGSYIEDAASLERLYRYCGRDVEVERALSNAVPPLTDDEQPHWELDARINERGFYVDCALLDAAYEVATEAGEERQAEFRGLTGLNSTNQTRKLIAWLGEHGCEVTDVQKGTLKHALRRKGLAPEARRAIELRLELAHASANKVKKLIAWRAEDGRVRGAMIYHGTTTGRWTSYGVQIQNFKRDGENVDAKIAAVMNGGDELDSPVEAVGDIARAMICAPPGYRLMIGDFSGIESRLLAQISGQISKVEQWRRFDQTGDPHDEPYYINGRRCGLPEEKARDPGKVMDLAFGFGGGPGAWKKHAKQTFENDNTSAETIQQYCNAWRTEHRATVQYWYALRDAAIGAVRNPGQERRARNIRLCYEDLFLRVTLPSGRAISYPFARIGTGRFGDPAVIFKTVDDHSRQWVDYNRGFGAWHGTFIENVVSACARDILAATMQRLEAARYPVIFTVHDEIVCEVPNGFGSLEEFKRLLTAPPDWAEELPIAAKVRESLRFSKPSTLVDPIEAADDALAELLDGDDAIPTISVSDEAKPITPVLATDKEREPNGAGHLGNERRAPTDGLGDDNSPPAQLHRADLPPLSVASRISERIGAGAPRPAALGNGRGRQANGKVCCPFHDDTTPSLHIYNTVDDPHYHCFGCGAHGPLSDLSEELIAAASSSTPHEQADDAETLAYAHRLWEQAQSIAGTLAARYLTETRRIDINALALNIETVLRFHPACPFKSSLHPCLLALFRDVETDEPAGIHRIALTSDAEKIDRRMLGRWVRPRAIKLWQATDRLYWGEGIETVLAAATRIEHRGARMQPAWAGGSSGSVAKLPIIAGVERLGLLVDPDDSGREATRVCGLRWVEAGRIVAQLTPQQPQVDFNDLLFMRTHYAPHHH